MLQQRRKGLPMLWEHMSDILKTGIAFQQYV
jgi:hypothetical protein